MRPFFWSSWSLCRSSLSLLCSYLRANSSFISIFEMSPAVSPLSSSNSFNPSLFPFPILLFTLHQGSFSLQELLAPNSK
uniref:Secreted protein n=1 Tax=Rhizophora mucronata TaxID=61149 RepID=A0A2P2P0T7_RHIMU